jgi:hypothetical protein
MNDIAVIRLELDQLKLMKEDLLSKVEGLAELEEQISDKTRQKDIEQASLMLIMKAQGLKSYKTNNANFSLQTRYSLKIDPAYEKHILTELKNGGDWEGYSLRANEFVSIKHA